MTLPDKEVLDWLKHAPVKYLECRDLGHPWKRRPGGWLLQRERGSVSVWTRTADCKTCGMERHDRRSMGTYERLPSRYENVPEGYYVPAGHGRLTISEIAQFEIESSKAKARSKRKAA